MLSYRDVPRTLTQNATLDRRRRQLFGNFVEAMFRRRGGKSRYSEEQTTRWLSSLASTLTRNNQTVFYLENIEFEWLPTRAKQLLARVGLIIAGGLIAGLIVWPIGFWLNQELTSGLLFGLIVGLIVGLLSAFLKLHPVERTGFRWTDVSSRKSAALRDGLTGGLIVGLLLGLLFGLSGGLISGGMFALKHFVLRLFLWKSGSAPLRYVAFLAQARDLLFLHQVGGGYIFTHRLLREYFVSLSSSKDASEETIDTPLAA